MKETTLRYPWVRTDMLLPELETPVLIVHKGVIKIGDRREEYPNFEDSWSAYWYWDDTNDEGQDWDRESITHWMPLSPLPPLLPKLLPTDNPGFDEFYLG